MDDDAGLPGDSGLSGDSGLAGDSGLSGDDLLRALAALASPHRLRIIAALTPGRNYVSELARQLQINRPLLYMHLQRLEAAGLVSGTLETARDGSSVKYFEVVPFAMALTPEAIAEAVRTLGIESPGKKGQPPSARW